MNMDPSIYLFNLVEIYFKNSSIQLCLFGKDFMLLLSFMVYKRLVYKMYVSSVVLLNFSVS